MKNLLCVVLISLFLVGCNNTTQSSIPENRGRITDNANILTKDQIETLASKLKQNKQIQTAILLVKTLNGNNIEDYSHDVFHEWKLGEKDKDNGLLLVIAVSDHKFRIQTGFGTEAKIVNMDAGRILDLMKPSLKNSDFYSALDIFINQVNKGN